MPKSYILIALSVRLSVEVPKWTAPGLKCSNARCGSWWRRDTRWEGGFVFPRAQHCRQVSLGLQIERREKGNPVTSDGSDRLLLEIWLLEKINITDIFFFSVEKYFAVVFIIVFFFSPFSFLFGNDFISMDQAIPLYRSNSSVFFFSFF